MGQNWVKCEMSVNGRWMVLTRTDLAGSLLRRISQSSFIWNSLSGRWLLLWPALCSNDRSSEAVWCGDDLSSDRHFLPLIDHRKKVPVRRAIIWKNYFTWAIIWKKLFHMSDHRKKVPVIRAIISPPTISDDISSDRKKIQLSDHLTAKTMPTEELPPTEYVNNIKQLVSSSPALLLKLSSDTVIVMLSYSRHFWGYILTNLKSFCFASNMHNRHQIGLRPDPKTGPLPTIC